MRVKICGLMRAQDVASALDSGTDAVGFVVSCPSSPRNLSLSKAQNLMKQVSLFTTKVAVTSVEDTRSIDKICSKLRPDALQLHQYQQHLLRYIKRKHSGVRLILARGVKDHSSVELAGWTLNSSDAILADSPGSNGMGGTGRTHNWDLTAALRDGIYPHPLILAGGLTSSNVQQAIRKVKPFAVDVSSGVEKDIGVKDPVKISNFIRNAKEHGNS
jgi:phosphoribosylanthranilate isomerase